MSLVCRPRLRPFLRRAFAPRPRVRPVCPRAALGPALDAARVTGHALGAFVLFYSSLQWAHYRRLRLAAQGTRGPAPSKGEPKGEPKGERKGERKGEPRHEPKAPDGSPGADGR